MDDGAFFSTDQNREARLQQEESFSMDALFYGVGSKASKKWRKYRRKDWVSMVPLGGPRRSGRLRSSVSASFLLLLI